MTEQEIALSSLTNDESAVRENVEPYTGILETFSIITDLKEFAANL